MWVGISLYAVLLAPWAQADTSPKQEQQNVSIRAQGVPEATNVSVPSRAKKAVLRAFLAEHPHIQIEPFMMPKVGGSTGSMDSGPLMAIAAGIPPHAIYVNFRQSSTYMSQGFLQPLEVLLARMLSDNPQVRQADKRGDWLADPSGAEVAQALAQIKLRVAERAWPVVYREDESGRYKGKHVWAIPTSSLVSVLLYRRDVFYESGLNPDQPPRTWDELLVMARKLTIPERGQYAMSWGPELSYSSYSYLVSSGARAVARDEEGKWYAAYGSQEAAQAYSFVWKIAKEPFERDGQMIPGTVKFSGDSMLWKRGQIGMTFGYLNEEILNTVNPQLVGIAPVPAGPNGQGASEINAQMLGVFSGSSPEQKLAVMQYIWFTTSEKAQRIRTEVFVENGFGQFVSPRLLKKFGYDRILKQVPKGWQDAFSVAMKNGVPEPYGKNTQNVYRYLTRPLSIIMEWDLADTPEDQRVERIHALLAESAQEFDVKVLGTVPPEQMRQRRIVASIVLVVLVIIFLAGFWHIWQYFTRVSARPYEGKRKFSWGYVLIMPGLLLTLLWMYLPLVGGIAIAFADYRIVLDSTFVGVDNFANVLYDERFWLGFARTSYYVGLMVVLGFWPPILLAILLDEVPTETLKYFFRTIFYLPAIISGVIIMFLWRQLYDPSAYGAFNQVWMILNSLGTIPATGLRLVMVGLWVTLVLFLFWLPIRLTELGSAVRTALWLAALVLGIGGIWGVMDSSLASWVGPFELEPLRFIQSPLGAMFWVVVPSIWAGAGPGCLLYLAALKTIPSDLYEAADIDGAGFWQKVFYITLPRLKFLITIQFIAAVVGAFKGGTNFILAMTGGGPNDATMILALEIFVRSFMDLAFGTGAAMAWLLGAVLISFTAFQLKMLSRAEFKAGGS